MGVGAAIAAGVAVAAGVGGGIAAGKAKGKAAKKAQKEADRSYSRDLARIEAAKRGVSADAQRSAGNIMAVEQARNMLYNQLGRPGTYETSPRAGGPIGLGTLAPSGVGGLAPVAPGAAPSLGVWNAQSGEVGPQDVGSRRGGTTSKWNFDAQKWESQGFELDPEAMASTAMDSQGFRNMSRMMAESGQLLAGEGELYNKYTQSIVGGTFGATAARSRVVADEIVRESARTGGDATSKALKFAAKARAQEDINRTHVGTLWQSKLAMETQFRNYAGQVEKMAREWVGSAVRDTFVNVLNQTQNYWTNVMLPELMPQQANAASKVTDATMQAQQMALEAQMQKISAISNGVASLGSIVGGGMGGGGGLGGMLGGMMGGGGGGGTVGDFGGGFGSSFGNIA